MRERGSADICTCMYVVENVRHLAEEFSHASISKVWYYIATPHSFVISTIS